MGKKRILVGYGIIVDAISDHTNTTVGGLPDLISDHANTTVGGLPDLMNVSRSVFGATRGVERLLELWACKKIKCSWFIPGHTLESFPNEMARVRDAGHEIGVYNYTHEKSAQLSHEQLEAAIVKSIDIHTRFCGGVKPKGFAASYWNNNPHQIQLLEKHGILYDHTFMHDDFQPYFISNGYEETVPANQARHPDTWTLPMKESKTTPIVEIPASWCLDDWPPFHWDGSRPNAHGHADAHSVERQWREQFEWCYREYDRFVFPMTIHPQISGRPHILLMHERLIDWINTHPDVEWCTFATMADEFRSGKYKEKRAWGWLT